MIYILDASALITAHNTYLTLHRVPEFWDWIMHHGEQGTVKLPPEIFGEVADGNDDLADWMGSAGAKQALLMAELDAGYEHVQAVLALYGNPLSEADLQTIGNDAFLIAAAVADRAERCVVSAEVSKASRKGANRHVPDVSKDCGVRCITPPQLLVELDFSTGWRG